MPDDRSLREELNKRVKKAKVGADLSDLKCPNGNQHYLRKAEIHTGSSLYPIKIISVFCNECMWQHDVYIK